MTGHSPMLLQITHDRQADVIRRTRRAHLVREAELSAMGDADGQRDLTARRRRSLSWLLGRGRRVAAGV